MAKKLDSHGFFIALVLLTVVLFGTIGAALAEESPAFAEEPLNIRLMNGDFEEPHLSVDEIKKYDNEAGGQTGRWFVRTVDYFNNLADNRFYWKTTASDQKIEYNFGTKKDETDSNGNPLGDRNNPNTIPGIAQDDFLPSNEQCAELVAEDQSSLYQTITTFPGELLTWGLSHRARKSDRKDTMALFIGPAQEDSLLRKTDKSQKDMFMWMGELLKASGLVEYAEHNNSMVAQTVYSAPDTTPPNLTETNYTEYFSLTKTDKFTQEWKCWIITSDYSDWYRYKGKYSVPNGQSATTFAFTALTAHSNGSDYLNEGNLLDNITFQTRYPLTVSTTIGGEGATVLNGHMVDDETGDYNLISENKLVTRDPTSDPNAVPSFTEIYPAGLSIDIDIKPHDNHLFIGAMIDDRFYPADGADSIFTKGDGNDYILNKTLDGSLTIHLMFSQASTVIYDPNGGVYNNTSESTVIHMANQGNNTENPPKFSSYTGNNAARTGTDSYGADKYNFLGWYFARGGEKGLGDMIIDEHTVTYDTGSSDDASDDILTVQYKSDVGSNHTVEAGTATERTKSVSVDTGLIFVAQWEYLQRAIPMTKGIDALDYSHSKAGGHIAGIDAEENMIIQKSGTSGIRRAVTVDAVSQYGYGRENDLVTIKAVANEGYTFMGWYERTGTPGNYEYKLLTYSDIYSYSVYAPKEIEARFSASLIYPYLSYVSENPADGLTEADKSSVAGTPFAAGTHLKMGNTELEKTGYLGKTDYGNTITTGFVANQRLRNLNASNSCEWTITIPAGSATYVKVPYSDESKSGYPFTFADAPLLQDSAGVQEAKRGNIFNVTGIKPDADVQNTMLQSLFGMELPDDGEGAEIIGDDAAGGVGDTQGGTDGFGMSMPDEAYGNESIYEDYEPEPVYDYGQLGASLDANGNLVIRLHNKLPATISGNGVIVFGLVIDNIYAPGATAELTLAGEPPTEGFNDISGEGVHAYSMDEYNKDY